MLEESKTFTADSEIEDFIGRTENDLVRVIHTMREMLLRVSIMHEEALVSSIYKYIGLKKRNVQNDGILYEAMEHSQSAINWFDAYNKPLSDLFEQTMLVREMFVKEQEKLSNELDSYEKLHLSSKNKESKRLNSAEPLHVFFLMNSIRIGSSINDYEFVIKFIDENRKTLTEKNFEAVKDALIQKGLYREFDRLNDDLVSSFEDSSEEFFEELKREGKSPEDF